MSPVSSHQLMTRVLNAPTDLIDQVRFFSRLPVPDTLGSPYCLPVFARGAGMIPLAGLIIGLLPAAVMSLGLMLSLPPLAVAGLAIGTQIILTGALHEDGLADVLDGFWGGMSPERRLDIMKDSRLGAYGVLGLVINLLLKTALLAGLITSALPITVALIYLSLFAVSRGPMVWLWYALPHARTSGLSHDAGQPDRLSMVIALVISIGFGIIPVACLYPLSTSSTGFFAGLTGTLLALAIAWGCAQVARHKIGGQTGDVLGACQQGCEMAYLLGLVAILQD